MTKYKPNPHCPVHNCRTTVPHRQQQFVNALMGLVEHPHLMCSYVAEGLSHLGNSACNDLANRNAVGFMSRLRQVEELYIRTLYLLLIAKPPEQEHMVAGATPNGLSSYYKKVNENIFENQASWDVTTPGLNGDTFTIMETLHDGAHVSFRALVMARTFFEHEPVMTPERYAKHVQTLVQRVAYMQGMFQSGKPREHVLEGIKAQHRPASYWAEQSAKAKQNSEEGSDKA